MKCLIKYFNNTQSKCYCNKLDECKNCNNTTNRNINDDKCNVPINSYCTCRGCGGAVRVSNK